MIDNQDIVVDCCSQTPLDRLRRFGAGVYQRNPLRGARASGKSSHAVRLGLITEQSLGLQLSEANGYYQLYSDTLGP